MTRLVVEVGRWQLRYLAAWLFMHLRGESDTSVNCESFRPKVNSNSHSFVPSEG